MYDAGSAVYTLTGRVIRDPFVQYGKLVSNARLEKEHSIVLGADTNPTGFDAFTNKLKEILGISREASVQVDAATSSMAASINKMATATDRDLGTVDDAFSKVTDSAMGMGASFADVTDSVVKSTAKVGESSGVMADEHKAAADDIVANNAKIIASTEEVRKNYANPMGAGGGGRGGGKSGTGSGASDAEEAGSKAGSDFKKGFNKLAGVGKWTTLGILGVGAISLKESADFQKQMELLATNADYSEKSVAMLNKQVLALAPAVGIGPTKLAEGLFHIASSGIPAAKAMDVLTVAAKGAQIGNANLEDTTNALMAVMKTAPKDVTDTTDAMGIMIDIVGKGNMRMEDLTKAMSSGILPAAKGVGLGLKDVGAALDVMTIRGVPAEQAATRLRTTLNLIANPTAKAKAALEELGITQDELAKKMRSQGLVPALQDLQDHMNKMFGHKLDASQLTQALTQYGNQLQAAGASTATIQKDMVTFKQSLDETGSGAIKSSQLISEAFGGSRMGTTMMMLMQNIGDLKNHVTDLNTASNHAAETVAQKWAETQKTFSFQADQVWASIQKLGIVMGDFLMPKVEALVKWLIEAGKWLGKHKELADALAIAFGTVLTAAVVAFFTRFIANTGKSIYELGKFGAQIFKLPGLMEKATAKIVEQLNKQKVAIDEVAASADGAGESMGAMGDGVHGGTAGGAGGAAGVASDSDLIGMINGVKGLEAPGSEMNPLAVVVLAGDQFGLGSRGAAADEKTASELEGATGEGEEAVSEGGVILPPGVKSTTAAAAEPVTTAAKDAAATGVDDAAAAAPKALEMTGESAEALAGSTTMMAGLKGALATGIGGLGTGLSKVMGAGMTAGLGLMATQIGSSIVGSIAGKKVGHDVSDIGTGASIGAAAGSLIPIPGLGTLTGAGAGAAIGALVAFLGGQHQSHASAVTTASTSSRGIQRGLGNAGVSSSGFQATLQAELEKFDKLTDKTITTTEARPGGKGFTGTQQVTQVVHIVPDMDTAAGREAAAVAVTMGQQIGAALVSGWSKYTIHSEPAMFTDFEAAAKKMPVQAQAAAAETAVKYAEELEKDKDLPAGAAQKLVDQIKSKFPQLVQYMGENATSATKAFNKGMDPTDVINTVSKMISKVEGEVEGLQPKVSASAGGIQQDWNSAWSTIEADTNSSLTGTRQNSLAILKNMVSDAQAQLPYISQIMATESANGQQALGQNFAKAAAFVAQNMKAMGLSTQQGMDLVNKLTGGELKAMGAPTSFLAAIPGMGVVRASGGGNDQVGLHAPGVAVGGYVPGGEFGHGDVMTLVDPTGTPRAKMAGDEAIFNKHQMPYVNAGLQALGFGGGASDLWNTVTTPHSYSGGGRLARFAKGGSVDQYNHVYPSSVALPPTAIAQIAQAAGLPGITFEQISEGESGFRPGAVEPSEGPSSVPGEVGEAVQGFGLWQITTGVGNDAMIASLGGKSNMLNPIINAKAAKILYQGAGNSVSPWHGTKYMTNPDAPWTGQQLSGSIGALGSSATFTPIKAPKWTGPGGALGAVGKGAVSKATSAANAYISAHAPTLTGGVSLIKGGRSESVTGTAGVRSMITEANAISSHDYNYEWGGGHGSIGVPSHGTGHGSGPGVGFDCSGSVSAVLHAAGLLNSPLVASDFMSWGDEGPGKFVSIFASPSHTFMEIMGHYFGTSTAENPGGGANWMPTLPETMPSIRHPKGYAGGGSLSDSFFLSPPGRSSWNLDATKLPKADQQRLKTNPNATLPGLSVGGMLNFASGGALPGFATGGSRKKHKKTTIKVQADAAKAYAPQSGHTGDQPGYRPVRVRQGKSGLHTVGGGSTKGLSTGLGTTKVSKPKQGSRPKQTVSGTIAVYLKNLGLGNFASAQTELGNLDTQYNQNDETFQLEDPNGYSQDELNVLQGIREQEWDILYGEYQALPGAISYLKGQVGAIGTPAHTKAGKKGKVTNVAASGELGKLTDTITADETDIYNLDTTLNKDIQTVAKQKHQISQSVLTAAGTYALQMGNFYDQHIAIVNKQTDLSNARVNITKKEQALPSSTAAQTPAQIAAGVVAGQTPASTSSSISAARKALQAQMTNLRSQSLALADQARALQEAQHKLLEAKDAAALKARTADFNIAWALELKRYKIDDKIKQLRQAIVNLKKQLALEKTAYTTYESALSALTADQTGGTSGGESILQSLGDIGYDMLDLVQQGAGLPVPSTLGGKARTSPTQALVESIMSAAGISIPAALSAPTAADTEAYTDFQDFQADRANLFSQYGSNFAAAGSNPFAGTAGGAAGTQFFGAASGPASGGSGFAGGGQMPGYASGGSPTMGPSAPAPSTPGGTTINIEQHFASGPSEPHTYASGLNYEIKAQM